MKSSSKLIVKVASLRAALFLLITRLSLAQTSASTVTTLTISPSGSVPAGTVLTLTASVASGGKIVHPGSVLSSAPAFILPADFDGDGITDLGVVDYGNETVTILAGKGDGTFANVSTASVPTRAAFTLVGTSMVTG